jgi:hypothetical protein
MTPTALLKFLQTSRLAVQVSVSPENCWLGLIYLRVRPQWIRYSDYNMSPPEIAEFRVTELVVRHEAGGRAYQCALDGRGKPSAICNEKSKSTAGLSRRSVQSLGRHERFGQMQHKRRTWRPGLGLVRSPSIHPMMPIRSPSFGRAQALDRFYL